MARETRLNWVSAFGFLVAIGVFFFVAFIAPDGGSDATWVRTGLVYAAMFAAPPIALLLADPTPKLAVAVGGGTLMAGLATTPGGNLLGLVMAIVGLLVLFLGASPLPSLSAALVAKLAAYGIVLTVAVWLVFDERLATTLVVLLLAGLVAFSGRLGWLWSGASA